MDFVIGGQTINAIVWLLLLAFVQNVSFSIVSRSRNRNNMKYHMIAAFFSNGIWFLTFRELVRADMTLILFIPYTIGTITGSVYGAKISMWIENKIGAISDAHVKPKWLDARGVQEVMVVENVRKRLYLKGCTVGPSDQFLDDIYHRFGVELEPRKLLNDAATIYNEIVRLRNVKQNKK